MAGMNGRTKRLGSGSMGKARGPGREKPLGKEKPFTKSKRLDQGVDIESFPELVDYLVEVHGTARAYALLGYITVASRDYPKVRASMTHASVSRAKTDLRAVGITPKVIENVMGITPASASRIIEAHMGRPRTRPLKTG